MEFKYKFNHDHLQDCFQQVWEADEKYGGSIKVYEDLAPYEYNQIKDYLPFSPKRVMEVGAGLARGSVYLNSRYKEMGQDPEWFLADRDGFSEENTGAFKPKEDEYYCSFERTKSFAKLNGIKTFWLFDTEKDDWAQLPQMDLIFSFCSFGMHVELERYMDRMLSVLAPEGVMIFGTRHAGYNDKSFTDNFKEVIFKPGLGQAPFPNENWLILRGKK